LTDVLLEIIKNKFIIKNNIEIQGYT